MTTVVVEGSSPGAGLKRSFDRRDEMTRREAARANVIAPRLPAKCGRDTRRMIRPDVTLRV